MGGCVHEMRILFSCHLPVTLLPSGSTAEAYEGHTFARTHTHTHTNTHHHAPTHTGTHSMCTGARPPVAQHTTTTPNPRPTHPDTLSNTPPRRRAHTPTPEHH